MPVAQLGGAGPDLCGWCSEESEDGEQLLDFRLAAEERASDDHFGEDASDAPRVYSRGVALGAEEDFWRAVPERDDVVGVFGDGEGEDASQSKVCELDGLGLEVDE
jgi:hypothetical protein